MLVTSPLVIALAAGSTATVPWPLAPDQRWYDLTLTSSSDPRFLRRLAGHLDNGQPSASDPALGAAR